MEAMRESWTDERLDDFRAETARRFDTLERRVDSGFKETKSEFVAVRREMNERFDGMDRRFEGIDRRFDAMQDRLEAIHRMMFRFCVLAMTALIGTMATIVTQL